MAEPFKFKNRRLPLAGCRVRFAGERAHSRQDGTEVTLWAWQITCAECGEWFEFTQAATNTVGNGNPELDLGRLTRRCEPCRPNRSR